MPAPRLDLYLHSADRLEVAGGGAASRDSAGRQCGAGSCALPRPASTGACAQNSKPGEARQPEATVQRVVALTCDEAAELRPRTRTGQGDGRGERAVLHVQRIWAALNLQRRAGCARLSAVAIAEFLAKLEDIVGLYMAPPTKRAKFRRSTGPSRACHSSPARRGP